MGSKQVPLTHLQYADNTIIFSQEKLEDLLDGWGIISFFVFVAGLSINVEKSSLIRINMEEEVLCTAANTICCKIESLPFNYLGFLLGGNANSIGF